MTDYQNNNGQFVFEVMEPPITMHLTDENIAAIQEGLRNVGLTCSDNDPANIRRIAKEMIEAQRLHAAEIAETMPGYRLFMEAAPNRDVDYTFLAESEGLYHDKVMFLLANTEVIESRGIIALHRSHKDLTFESSTIGAIATVFTDAACSIGNLGEGYVEPAQVMKNIGDSISKLSETEKKDYHETDEGVLFGINITSDDNTYNWVAGGKYKYVMDIEDYSDKKTKTHKAFYEIDTIGFVFGSTFGLDYAVKAVWDAITEQGTLAEWTAKPEYQKLLAHLPKLPDTATLKALAAKVEG